MPSLPPRGLYAIVDPAATGDRDPERVAEAVLTGGCARLQLRVKDGPDAAHLGLARRLGLRCRAAGVPFVMNDRADLAVLADADGLHLGQDDISVADARGIVGNREIGLSTHDSAQADAARAAGADLIAFGPVFDTTSKENPDPTVGLEALRAICRAAGPPVVAIGGISVERAPAIRAAGASYGAVIRAVCGADDPESAARALHAALGGVS